MGQKNKEKCLVMIKDSLSRRAHVWKYREDKIPTEKEIIKILQTAYPLVSSKQKAYAYKAYILGPNKARSKKLYNMCEGNKIRTDEAEFGKSDEAYRSNPGLYHILSAPYTIIYTPRIAPPNPFHKRNFEREKSKWQLEDPIFVNTRNRTSNAIEIGMLAKTVTGVAMDRGWDSSYCVCLPKNMEDWKDFPYIDFYPDLIQTIGLAEKYKWQFYNEEQLKADTDAPFADIFNFVDRSSKKIAKKLKKQGLQNDSI